MARCWNCGVEGGNNFCQACGKVQPFPADIDYFRCMGLPRFLSLDLSDLEKRFHQKARDFHPDFYQARSDKERSISLENSAILNKAYRVLRDPIRRIEYLLELEGGKSGGGSPAPPQELFEEIMELQEALEEIPLPQGKVREALTTKLKEGQKRLEEKVREIEKKMGRLSAEWDLLLLQGEGQGRERIMEEMRECLSLRTYLTHTLRDVGKKIS